MAADEGLKARLLKSRLPEAEIDVEGVGTIRVRGLSRVEVMGVQSVKDGPGKALAIERKILAAALVDPEMTEAEVGQWQKASTAGEMEPVTDKVGELSGMAEDAAKDAYKEFEADPDAEFRVLPGSEVVDDGGPAEG